MNRKRLLLCEIICVFVTLAGVVFLWNLYELLDKSTICIIFGAVNSSIWEKAKCISICCILLGLTELISVKPPFRQFVVAKIMGISLSLILFIILKILSLGDITALVIAILCGFVCSYLLTVSAFVLSPFFAPACFLIMLIFMMTFSFTAFAPQLEIFKDPYTGCYGVLPQPFDYGAVSLGT